MFFSSVFAHRPRCLCSYQRLQPEMFLLTEVILTSLASIKGDGKI